MTLVVTPGGDLVGLVSTYGPDGNPVGKAKANGWQGVVLVRSSDGSEVNLGSPGDGSSNSIFAESVSGYNLAFNGATWDRQRGNTEGTLLASAARTATTISPIQTNHNARGVHLFLDISANPGGADTLSLLLYGVNPVTGLRAAAIANVAVPAATSGLFELQVYPGINNGTLAAGAATVSKPFTVPRSWLAQVTHSGATSFTYSLGYSLIV